MVKCVNKTFDLISITMTLEHKKSKIMNKISKRVHFNKSSNAIFNKLRDFYHSDYFFEASAPIFAVAQCFGAMPMYGILSKDVYKLRFEWKSLRVLYSITLICSQIMFLITILYSSIENGLTISKFTLYVVYTSVIYIMIMMLLIARKWPSTMRYWRKVELCLPPIQDGTHTNGMGSRIRIISPIVIFLSLSEHLLGLIATSIAVIKCPVDVNDPGKSFFIEHLPVFFDATYYTPWKAVLAKFANLVNTFMWFYVDLFIMIVALGLSTVFRQYCDFLLRFSGKRVTKRFWDEQRAAYRQICELIEYVDKSKRFLEDVTDTVSALSGMRFFYLTRKLLLSVAGTIVTYELVILQFYDRGSGSGIRVCNSTINGTST
uniref:Gustatory receptor n=1 Tax=Culicoides sonorensis TaxID=179676 RepID=A0A336LDD5_CULSO